MGSSLDILVRIVEERRGEKRRVAVIERDEVCRQVRR